MKKILNPYDSELNMCFGCGQKNPMGLKLRFTESDDYLHAVWQPTETYQGYPNVLHGGIIAALLDEIGAWCVSVKLGTAGVTIEMNTKYLNPVYINKGVISLQASIEERTGKNAKLICQLFDGQSKLCAESVAEYFLYPEEIARRRFRYPGRDAFYEKEL
jgi:uncharacterized protein (TIGR00369 family)